jgi:hypothetical protein
VGISQQAGRLALKIFMMTLKEILDVLRKKLGFFRSTGGRLMFNCRWTFENYKKYSIIS